jgi:hypothetical protein
MLLQSKGLPHPYRASVKEDCLRSAVGSGCEGLVNTSGLHKVYVRQLCFRVTNRPEPSEAGHERADCPSHTERCKESGSRSCKLIR